MEKLVAIGCDGTNVNTGCDGGVIRLLEVHCNKSLYWFVCLLHMNELLFCHLLIHIDGVTLGPKLISGPIGKETASCSNLVHEYQPIQGNTLQHINPDDLSNDQRYY